MAERVIKHFSLTDFKTVGADGHFEGVLSTYGNEDLVGDVCDVGCWDESVKAKGGKFPLLWQHDQGEPIGSFRVKDTASALVIEGNFNQEVRRGQEAFALLKAGDICGLSVGFNLMDWAYVDGVRHVTRADLWEGSFVTFPANPSAYAEAKSMAMAKAAGLRKSVAGLTEFKSLSKETQDAILRAIDEALDGEAPAEDPEQDETKDEEEAPKEDEPASEDEGAGEPTPEEEEEMEAQKALASAVAELKASALQLQTAIREV